MYYLNSRWLSPEHVMWLSDPDNSNFWSTGPWMEIICSQMGIKMRELIEI